MTNIITSLLDLDLYKITQMQFAFHQFPETECTYGFKCRSGEDLRPYADEIRREINSLSELVFTGEELQYLNNLSFIKDDFLEHLASFTLDPHKEVQVHASGDEMRIEIAGTWVDTILYETLCLSIVEEVYFKHNSDPDKMVLQGLETLRENIDLAEQSNFKFADFGTRRRYSKEWQRCVVRIFNNDAVKRGFIGTSNVDLARRYDLPPVGTMAHEYFQAMQVLAPSLEETQAFALECWKKEYGDELQIALTDIFGMDTFLADFTPEMARHFSGLRHDSGDPKEWGEKAIEFYKKNDIDPLTKMLVFSDGLDFPTMKDLSEYFEGKANVSFGIGTNLTNDVGVKPLSIVMKMITCNGKPTAKISDSPGKLMCRDEEYVQRVNKMIAEKTSAAWYDEVDDLNRQAEKILRERKK